MKRDHWHDSSPHRGIALGHASQRPARSSRLRKHHGRFVMQTHALGKLRAPPSSLLIVGIAAIVLYVMGRRWSR